MLKNVHTRGRIVALLALALCFLFGLGPTTFAATSAAHTRDHLTRPGSAKKFYLALGDSLAFGFQPNLDFKHGYVDDLSKYLVQHQGFMPVANMGCNGESSTTMLNGKCPYPTIRKYPYKGAQFEAALDYIHAHSGQVALVTLDIGANDTKNDVDPTTCKINEQQFLKDLATLDANLTRTILPGLHTAMTVNGHLIGRIVMMNYYDPFQNICTNTVPGTELVNRHLASDVARFGSIVDVFMPFGGAKVPNEEICEYTWMCGHVPDIHANDLGYRIIADIFAVAIHA